MKVAALSIDLEAEKEEELFGFVWCLRNRKLRQSE
jgi:hypothetical protein